MALCLLAAGHSAGLKFEFGRWLLAPGLGAVLGGVNASLLFRVMRENSVPVVWTILLCLLFAGVLYAVVQWLLHTDEQNDQNHS